MGLTLAQRGAVYVNVTTRGKQAHTIAAHEGVNAINHMVTFIEELQRLELPYEPHPLLGGPPLMNVGTIHGGTKHNQVPDRCTISVDFRIVPGQSAEDVVSRLQGIVAKLHAADPTFSADVELSPYWLSGPRVPFEADPDWEIVRATDEAFRLATGTTPAHQGFNAWTDMAVLWDAGIECVNIGPGDPPYNFADEFVYLDQYHDAVAGYVAAAMLFCRAR
jgi:acetylornithine deacetylase/succinyl-diaminopimelate desuccinylase-like protein